MPTGTCDPASRGDAFNQLDTAVANGDVVLTVRYGWDGVTTRATGCDGPLVNGTGTGNVWAIKAVNLSATTYYAHTISRTGNARTLTLNAGQTRTITATQAASQGYVNRSDVDDLVITTTP